MQGKVAERLFQAYFVNGEDVGDRAVLLSIARDFGVSASFLKRGLSYLCARSGFLSRLHRLAAC
jgi:predicted DsbA family dithiol-disulfide isomerase